MWWPVSLGDGPVTAVAAARFIRAALANRIEGAVIGLANGSEGSA